MESNRSLLFFIFGISLLPKIYSDVYPSLFVMKQEILNSYLLADKFEYVEGQTNVIKFFTFRTYLLYNSCPEENSPYYPTYALKVQHLVTDFKGEPLQEFVQGLFDGYNCPKQIKPVVLKHKEEISDKNTSDYDIGFLFHHESINSYKVLERYEDVPDGQNYDFFNFLTITLDAPSGSVILARHMVNGKQLPDEGWVSFPATTNIPPFQNNDAIFGFNVNSLYTEENQKEIFSSIFGSSASLYYKPQRQCLIKVQLVPHEDFILDTWKLSTFVDLNTTAIWNQLLPQWKRVEEFVREVVRQLGEVSIETGATETLSLLDANDNPQPIYLQEGERSAVYRYVWKRIEFMQFPTKSDNKAIFIVMHNDPYTPNQQPICDVSDDFGWLIVNENYKTGLTYICPVEEDVTSMLYKDYKGNYHQLLNLQNISKTVYDEETGYFKSVKVNFTFNKVYR